MILRKVLVADDLPHVLSAVADLLRESFEVIALVSDGRAALEATLALEPDLVVLDISMPEMTGIEVARELKKRHSRARIVFFTVHKDADILAASLTAGGLGYVLKSHMETDLIPAMHEALAGRVYVSRFSPRKEPGEG
jgi:DNA-binding NarL/FixJ family response regulator